MTLETAALGIVDRALIELNHGEGDPLAAGDLMDGGIEWAAHAGDVREGRKPGNQRAVVARLAGVWMGSVVAITTSALVPAVCGKRAARRFCTCWDAELPESNDSWNRLPMDWPTTVITMMAAIQRSRTRRRWS